MLFHLKSIMLFFLSLRRLSGFIKNINKREERRGSFLLIFPHHLATWPCILPIRKRWWFISNLTCHPVKSQARFIIFKNFQMSFVITRSCSSGSGSDDSPFYSAVKNICGWRIIKKWQRLRRARAFPWAEQATSGPRTTQHPSALLLPLSGQPG